MRNIMHDSAVATFGRKTAKSMDWCDAKASEMTPVIEAKRRALAEDKVKHSAETKQALRAARSQVQQAARRCANEYWIHLSEEIQLASLTGDIRRMYEGIKKAFGPSQNKTAPLKSVSGEIISDKKKQMDRWKEHYSDLYSRENSVTASALEAIEPVPIMEELDAQPTAEELSKAIHSLAAG